MTRYSNVFIASLILLLMAPCAYAARIFLNGVEITGVKARTFTSASVRIDDAGDVYIDASQYEVRILDKAAESTVQEPAVPTVPADTWFLVTRGNSRLAQYNVTVKINGVERVTVNAGDAAAIEDIGKWLTPGTNSVQITAVKNMTGGRLSTSDKDALSLLIGKGQVKDREVQIEAVKLTFKCDASQLSDAIKSYSVVVK